MLCPVKNLIAAFVAASLLLTTVSAEARQQRSAKAKAEFKHQNPCPATGALKGSCPGYVVDDIEPLCAGGADTPDNMQWQSIEDGKRKDKHERRLCAEKH